IDVLVREALERGETEPKYHALTRPPETEGEATNRAIQLARVAGCKLYVVHVSCAESVEPIQIAREKGWDVWGESCTQYFFVDYTFLERPNFEGGKYVYTPPPRAKENQEVLWSAVRGDVLSVISTDHSAFLWDGRETLGRDDLRLDAPLALGLQPVRGHRGDRRAGRGPPPRAGARGRRRARGSAGRRPLRIPGALRRGSADGGGRARVTRAAAPAAAYGSTV